MSKLAVTAKSYGDVDVARKIAIDYIDNYLNKKSDADFYTADNLRFIF